VWKIAQRHGVSVASILKLNGLTEHDLIRPGDHLRIRGAATHTTAAKSTRASSSGSRSGGSYTVKSGDTLSAIAARHGVSLNSLLRSSGLKASSIIYPGQRISVSGGSGNSGHSTVRTVSSTSTSTSSHSPSSAGSSYSIKAGDTLSGIAAKHGTTVSALCKANHLGANSVIYVGKKLKVPGSSHSGSSTSSTGSAVPKKFLHYTYSDETNRNANSSYKALQSRAVPSASQMEAIIRSTAIKYGVNPNLAVAHAKVESGLNARAVSPANAVGAMQVLPSTAQWIGQTVGRKLDPLNPYDNAVAGVVYIGYLQRNASSVSQGIGAYYQGLGGIKKNGAQKDTKDYIKKVKSYM
jgi:LysM repeat protein